MAQEAVHWEATLDSAQRLAGQTNRLVLIQFWAPWCAVCKRMEADVFSQPSVAADMAANYVAVKINADHFPATAQQYGVTALPTTVITTPQGQLLDTIVGRVETADYVARLNQLLPRPSSVAARSMLKCRRRSPPRRHRQPAASLRSAIPRA